MSSADILLDVDIFADLNQAQLERIYTICTPEHYHQGDMIFDENSPSKEIYIILEGTVHILVNPDPFHREGQEPHCISRLSHGQCFGEVALVDQGLRSAAAQCGSPTCKLLVIDRDHFLDLLRSDLDMGFTILYNLATDLCLKIRRTTFVVRENLLYGKARG
ncbi:MAG: cyclic nucleotide-binding domain-containing protein [Anaerolineales bacterium]|nr:cyclic nucleotide-binding domain-containing protein [Anaerolineales bacterium]